ncbi:MAG TPA: lactonase family protein [Terriglobia bacterium]|nr:lactonase family protein [Terriglobia bacterium]
MSGVQRNNDSAAKASRRSFLKGAAVLAVAAPGFASSCESASRHAKRPILAWVATYSSQGAPEGSTGHGRGIYLFEMDPATGALTERAVFPNASNPSWLELDASQTHLYCSNEIADFRGTNSGSLSAYSIDRSNGHLTPLNTVSSEGAIPAHLSLHPSGKYMLVANYGAGTVAARAIGPNGEFGPTTDVQHYKGPAGSIHPASAPPGNFAISGHDAPHAHMIHTDPAGRFVLSTDLGGDKIMVWKFDVEKGKFSPNDPPSVSLPSGDGPRHFAFHPNGQWLYSVQEEGSTLVLFHYDGAKGTLSKQQTVSTLPKEFVGTNFTSEVRISSDGRFVYAANRLHDSISYFSIGPEGRLTYIGEEWTRGDYPRSITIDPTGNFIYSLNQHGDAITIHRVNRETGRLTFTGQYTPLGTPACMVFLNP